MGMVPVYQVWYHRCVLNPLNKIIQSPRVVVWGLAIIAFIIMSIGIYLTHSVYSKVAMATITHATEVSEHYGVRYVAYEQDITYEFISDSGEKIVGSDTVQATHSLRREMPYNVGEAVKVHYSLADPHRYILEASDPYVYLNPFIAGVVFLLFVCAGLGYELQVRTVRFRKLCTALGIFFFVGILLVAMYFSTTVGVFLAVFTSIILGFFGVLYVRKKILSKA